MYSMSSVPMSNSLLNPIFSARKEEGGDNFRSAANRSYGDIGIGFEAKMLEGDSGGKINGGSNPRDSDNLPFQAGHGIDLREAMHRKDELVCNPRNHHGVGSCKDRGGDGTA